MMVHVKLLHLHSQIKKGLIKQLSKSMLKKFQIQILFIAETIQKAILDIQTLRIIRLIINVLNQCLPFSQILYLADMLVSILPFQVEEVLLNQN